MFALLCILKQERAHVQIKADIASIDQGYVKPGDSVVIKLDAYRYMRHGVIDDIISRRSIAEKSSPLMPGEPARLVDAQEPTPQEKPDTQ